MRLTHTEKEFIQSKANLNSIRSIQDIFEIKFGRKISTRTIHKWISKVNEETETVNKVSAYRGNSKQKQDKERTKNETMITYPTTINEFLILLENNIRHPYADYFVKRLTITKSSASEFRKFFEFIRDIQEK